MNCAECKEQLVPYIESLLDDAQADLVAQHVKSCADCQAELKGLQTLQNRLVTNGKAVAQSDLEEQVMNRIMREQTARLKTASRATASLRLRRLIMKSPMTRIAAAAIVVLACVLAFSMWRETGSIALADVVAKVEQIQAYFYRETTEIQSQVRGNSTTEGTVLVSNEYGMKADLTTVNLADGPAEQMQMYLLPQEKSVVLVNLSEKKYARMALDDATLQNTRIEYHDPREMLKRLLACKYEELGAAVIEGVKVQGFATTDPNYLGDAKLNMSARVWVAVDTQLPIRSELEWDLAKGIHLSSVQHGYQWGIPVNASEFEPDIPADFTADQSDGTQMPSISAEGMIEALRIAAEFTGSYPASLDVDAIQQLMKDIVSADTPAARQLREQLKNAGSPEAAAALNQERLMKIMVMVTFTRMLGIQQAEPLYHGDVVTPANAQLPLMRWKLSDTQYQVIFGDLHTETVTPEALAQLEATLPQ